MNKACISLFIALLATTWVSNAADAPYLTGRVTDNAQILSENTRNSLTETLKEHEATTTNQIVILTIPSLEGENIEDFANKVFNEWKLGQKDKDNGILIVVVPDERKMRIEVGYGLEGTLTDLSAGRIIREIMTPRFRDGDFDGGITDGTLAVISVLTGKDLRTKGKASIGGFAFTSGSSGGSWSSGSSGSGGGFSCGGGSSGGGGASGGW